MSATSALRLALARIVTKSGGAAETGDSAGANGSAEQPSLRMKPQMPRSA